MPFSFFCRVLALTLVMTTACFRRDAGHEAPRDITVTTRDGVQLAATLFPVTLENPPALLLVHGPGETRAVLRPLAERLRNAGYLCLSFDLRGHGGSTRKGDKSIDYRSFDDDAWREAVVDIAAARQTAIFSGANPNDIGIVGTGFGAALALHYAVSDLQIASLVLVSPTLNDHGVSMEKDITATGMRPILIITAQDDAYAAASSATLKKLAPSFCELKAYAGDARGADLLAVSSNAMDQIVDWLRPILKSTKPPVHAPITP